MRGGAPGEGGVAAESGGAEAEEGVESGERDGVARREGAGGMGAGALVGEEPEVEAGGVTGEVGERGGERVRERAPPQGGEQVDGVVDEERIRVGKGSLVGRCRRRRRLTRSAASGGAVEVGREKAAEHLARRHGAGGDVGAFGSRWRNEIAVVQQLVAQHQVKAHQQKINSAQISTKTLVSKDLPGIWLRNGNDSKKKKSNNMHIWIRSGLDWIHTGQSVTMLRTMHAIGYPNERPQITYSLITRRW